MLIDFHSHFASANSIVCNADASEPAQSTALLTCAGLLPQLWTQKRQQQLFNLLDSKPDLQMGEVGLDRRFEDILSLERQTAILKEELVFAVSRDRSISLHCVRATKPMLDILSELNYRPYSILWHGFTGSPETAAELKRLKVILSIGPRFAGDINELLAANPLIVPETDYEGSDESEHQIILQNQYLRFPEDYPTKSQVIYNLFGNKPTET